MTDSSESEDGLPSFNLKGSHNSRAPVRNEPKKYDTVVLSSDSDSNESAVHRTAKRPRHNLSSSSSGLQTTDSTYTRKPCSQELGMRGQRKTVSRSSCQGSCQSGTATLNLVDNSESDSCEQFEVQSQQFRSPSSAVTMSSASSSQSQLTQESGMSLDSVEMPSDKELRRETKKSQAEARKMERERQRAEKRHQKVLHKAIKKAASEASKESRPGERVKQMVVILDTVLSENAQFMAEVAGELQALGVMYRVSHDLFPGSVRWKRSVSERSVTDEAQIVHNVTEKDEDEMLVMLDAQGFVGLVHYTKQVQLGASLPPGAQTLQQFVEGLQHDFPGMRLTLVVEGVDVFFRGNKTRMNRQFRNAVLATDQAFSARNPKPTTASDSRRFSDVTRVDCEEALVGLQLVVGCGVRLCANGAQLAEYVVTITKALAEVPYQRSDPFSFHSEPGSGASKKVLQEAENKVAVLWKHQLMQLNNMSDSMAAAVVATYPSPAHLLAEYEACTDQKSAELLLQNIMVRRGVGTVASTRRLGPVQSKRIYMLLTSRDLNLTLV